MLRYK